MALKKHIVDVEPSEEYGLIPLIELTYEEALAELDHAARRRLNMSGEEFPVGGRWMISPTSSRTIIIRRLPR